ncbi:MAG: hypothetical protein K1X48_09615 [Burkholderiaceae bacterium]|nr:hypothetical protein [Burkholderiaceae bacterium]
MTKREKVLQQLVSFSKPLDILLDEVKRLDWDFDGSSINMDVKHICGVLLRYINGELTTQDVESWANLVEGREDIDFESSHATVMDECIYELANPYLTSVLSVERAGELIQLLSRN